MKRVFLIVLDSLGIGAATDAAAFGDGGADTLRSLVKAGAQLPTLWGLGLGEIAGHHRGAWLGKSSYGRLRELSRGKDTTVGHWELMGVVSESPLPTYPNGFPEEVMEAFSGAIGRPCLCNRPYSGTAVLEDYGEEHLRTGAPIVYTSADSVFQVAVHESVADTDTLYEWCRIAREILQPPHGVGRVIARPFRGEVGNFVRTPDRRDFSLPPTGVTTLDRLCEAGLDVISIGKISDIFAGRGITRSYPTHSNQEGMEKLTEMQKTDFRGLCFANLVDFDMLYGHRRDPLGYKRALEEFDTWLAGFTRGIGEEDTLMVVADHGCDPTYEKTTDHTREDVPWLIYSPTLEGRALGVLNGFWHVGEEVLRLLRAE